MSFRKDTDLCEQTRARIQEIVDGEVPPDTALCRHVQNCDSCRHAAEAFEHLKEAIARVCDDTDPELVRRLQDAARKLCESGDCD